MQRDHSKKLSRQELTKEGIKVFSKVGNKIHRSPDGYTSDILVFVKSNIKEDIDLNILKIMLIQRRDFDSEGNPNTEGGKWAIPGGFVNEGETALEAANRELKEETCIDNLVLKHLGIYDAPGRDPRGWIISNVHYAIVSGESIKNRRANDDAKRVKLFSIKEALKLDLAFDHEVIIKDALKLITIF